MPADLSSLGSKYRDNPQTLCTFGVKGILFAYVPGYEMPRQIPNEVRVIINCPLFRRAVRVSTGSIREGLRG